MTVPAHDTVRSAQDVGHNSTHHVSDKIDQVRKLLRVTSAGRASASGSGSSGGVAAVGGPGGGGRGRQLAQLEEVEVGHEVPELLLELVARPREWERIALTGTFGIPAHTAYHLGAVRQMLLDLEAM